MRRAVALALVLLAAPAAAAPAGAAAPVASNVDRPGSAAVELVDRGPCPPCAWPAAGADWGPPLAAAGGETVELTLDAPADAVDVSATTNPGDGSAAAPVFGPLAAAPAAGGTPPSATWRVTLPDLGPHAREGLGLAVAVRRGDAGEAWTATLYTPSPFVVPSPRPPPFALHSVTLDRSRRTLVVRLQSVAALDVTITVARHGRRIAHGHAHIGAGRSRVVLRIGPRGRAALGRGRRVDVTVGVDGFRVRRAGVPLRRR